MRRILICAIAIGLAATVVIRRGPEAKATPPRPRLALLATHATEPRTSLLLVDPDATALPGPTATFDHLPDAAIRGRTLPSGRAVLAIADTLPGRDRSFGSSLVQLDAAQPARILSDRVVFASRPLVTEGGRVFVERGRPGEERAGRYRIDALTVDEIDPASGAARTLIARAGFAVHLAGAAGDEIYVYYVHAGGASLLAVDAGSGAVRTLTALLPFARDFSVEGGKIVFQERDEQRSDLWVIDRVDARSGARERLRTSSSQRLVPHLWPGGDVVWNDGEGRGLVSLGGALRAPAGPGLDVVGAVGDSGALVALSHQAPDAAVADVVVVETGTARARRLEAPPLTHLEIAGFVGAP